jgi:hypothetical protein
LPGISVAYLYSLYDERDMGATLATKQDLELLRLATKQDIEVLRLATKQDIESLRQELDSRFTLLTNKIETQTLRMTIRLGSMLFLGFGLIIAVLRLWSN